MNDLCGSKWRKWDLHIHTPASIVQHYGGDTETAWENFFKGLESLSPDIKVVGINDYIFLDGYRKVYEAKKSGRLKNLDLILPVIELRIDKFGGTVGELSRVNYHVVFSDELDPSIIEQQFLNALTHKYTLTPQYEHLKSTWQAVPTRDSLTDLGQKIIQSVPEAKREEYGAPLLEGFNNLNLPVSAIEQALNSHYFKDKYLTGIGKTEWWNIKWNDQSIADKKTIINNVDFVFVSAYSPSECDKAKQHLNQASVNDRLLDCSDSHRFANDKYKDRLGKVFTWIKADPTFEGLRMALYEYSERVYLGDKPEKIKEVESNKTKYIKSVSITKKPDADLSEIWFDNIKIELNHDLVAIIGNKGTGKSALSDILGLLGNTRNQEKFSFLSEQRFCKPNDNKAKNFRAELEWESGTSIISFLDDSVDHNLIETIKYIPQGLFEDICNEIASGEETNFDKELRKVIFSHVEMADRLGKKSLDDLINYWTEETYDAISLLKNQLAELNLAICGIEERLTDEYRSQLKDILESKNKEILSHEKSQPPDVPKPQDNLSQDVVDAFKKIHELQEKLRSLRSQQGDAKASQEKSALSLSVAEKLLHQIDNFQQQFDEFRDASSLEFEKLGMSFSNVVKLSIDVDAVRKAFSLFEEQRKTADDLLDLDQENSVPAQIISALSDLETLQHKLDEPNRLYQEYQSAIREWERERDALVGDQFTLNSLEYIKKELSELDDLPAKHNGLKLERSSLVKKIYTHINNLASTYRKLYKAVQDFIVSQTIARDELQLNFDVAIVNVDLQNHLFDWINRNVIGSFRGEQEGTKMLRNLVDRNDFNSEAGVMTFLDEIMDYLTHDKRSLQASSVRLSAQLRQRRDIPSLYDYLFSLDYLRPRYVLKLGEKELSQLSPGERGALLLIFYLLIDRDDIPLVIDQPEENLDNETIYRLLVKCIKTTKKKRQLIIVTHNPNLAVVCDAEQVICCSIDKKNGSKIGYTSGAIENPAINKNIVDVLEGTKPAFDNRKLKYQPLDKTPN